MWGISARVHGRRVQTNTPHWLMNARQCHSVAEYLQRVVDEMASAPDRYGFDPDNVYLVFIQTWDRAETPIRSLAFGRNVSGHDNVGLIPDVYYIDSGGYAGLRAAAVHCPPWEQRLPTVIWRGSVTGSGPFAAPDEIPRIRLALACKAMEDVDVALFGVHSTMENVLSIQSISDFLEHNRLSGSLFSVSSFGKYKFSIDIDGHANAWGLLEKLILGCCVLKVASPYEQWYYRELRAWTHYVPIAADLHDLAAKIDWCRSHQAECAWIARNGALLAESLALEWMVQRNCETFLQAAEVIERRRPDGSAVPVRRVARNASTDIFAAAEEDEAAGDLEAAIDSYSALVEQDIGGTEPLVRRAMLHHILGDFPEAVADMRLAERRTPEDPTIKRYLARLATLLSREQAAVALLVDALEHDPASAEARMAIAEAYSRLGWLDLANRFARSVPPGGPDWWPPIHDGIIAAHRQNRESAFSFLVYRRQMGGVLTFDQGWYLAAHLFAIGRLHAASRVVAVLAEDQPANLTVADLAAKIAARQSGSAAAFQVFEQWTAVRTAPLFAEHLARYALEQERFTLVRELLSAPAVPQTHTARRLQAIALLSLRERAALHAHCAAWMDDSPGDMLPAGLANLGVPAARIEAGGSSVEAAIGFYWDDPALPADIELNSGSWTRWHPGLAREIHNRDSAAAYLQRYHDRDVCAAFAACPDAKTRAAYFRWAWLVRSGGLFPDADQLLLQPAGTLVTAAPQSDLIVVREDNSPGYLLGRFLAGRAGSIALLAGLQEATAAVLRSRSEDRPLSPWYDVGAGLLTRIAARHFGTDNGAANGMMVPDRAYRAFARTDTDLGYKRTP